MTEHLRVLILEDNPNDADLMLHELEQAGFALEVERVETEEAFLAGLSAGVDVILADYALPQFGAMEALALLKQRELDLPFVIVSGVISEATTCQGVHAVARGRDGIEDGARLQQGRHPTPRQARNARYEAQLRSWGSRL